MITAALFALFRVVLAGFDAILPDWSLPDISQQLMTVKTKVDSTEALRFVAGANNFLPIEEAVTLAALLAALWLAVLLYRMVVWILTKAHVFGGA